MTSPKSCFVINTLEELYPNPHSTRSQRSLYFPIAVLLSAQSTDVRVNLTNSHLFAKAGNPRWLLLTVEKFVKSSSPWACRPKNVKGFTCPKFWLKIRRCCSSRFWGAECFRRWSQKRRNVAFGVPAFPSTPIFTDWCTVGVEQWEKWVQTEKDAKRLFQRSLEWLASSNYLVWARVPSQGLGFVQRRHHLNHR